MESETRDHPPSRAAAPETAETFDRPATEDADPRGPLAELFRDLRISDGGLSTRDANRRLVVYGPNELTRRGGARWPRQLFAQLTRPLFLLLAITRSSRWSAERRHCRRPWWR